MTSRQNRDLHHIGPVGEPRLHHGEVEELLGHPAVAETATDELVVGALAVGLGEGMSLSDAARFASAAAALSGRPRASL